MTQLGQGRPLSRMHKLQPQRVPLATLLRKHLRPAPAAVVDGHGQRHEAAALVKAAHRGGGAPLVPRAQQPLQKVATAAAGPAPAPTEAAPSKPDPGLTEAVQARLDRELVRSAVKDALAATPINPATGEALL